LVRLFASDVLDETALACLECPERADLAGILPSDLEITRDLVGGASRVVMIERR